MASWRLVAVAVAFVACAVAITCAQAQPAAPAPRVLGCPGAPWCPVWVNCSYTEVPGASCYDCSNRVICTPVGGLLQPCRLPWLKHCVNGQCRPNPSAECAAEGPTDTPEISTEAPISVPEKPDATPGELSAPPEAGH